MKFRNAEAGYHYGTIPLFLLIVCILPFLLYFHPPEDTEEWSLVEIKEAFIGKETYDRFRDDYSPAEFGWKIEHNKVNMGRIDLYGKFYIPVKRITPVNLVLIERDIFSDDIVTSVELKDHPERYRLNNNDFVSVNRESFFPDAHSGSDGKPAGAIRISGSAAGSVDFLSGDYTDYIKTSQKKSVLLIYTLKNSVDLTSPDESECVILPHDDSSALIHIADCSEKGDLLRIRGQVGQGRLEYNIFYADGGDARIKTAKKLFSLARKEDAENSSLFRNIHGILKNALPDEVRALCTEKNDFNAAQKQLCREILETREAAPQL